MAQLVENPPEMWETWVRSLGWGDPLEKGMATHSSILAWRIPWTVKSMGSQGVGLSRLRDFHSNEERGAVNASTKAKSTIIPL